MLAQTELVYLFNHLQLAAASYYDTQNKVDSLRVDMKAFAEGIKVDVAKSNSSYYEAVTRARVNSAVDHALSAGRQGAAAYNALNATVQLVEETSE